MYVHVVAMETGAARKTRFADGDVVHVHRIKQRSSRPQFTTCQRAVHSDVCLQCGGHKLHKHVHTVRLITEGEQDVPEPTPVVRIVCTSLHCNSTLAEAPEFSSQPIASQQESKSINGFHRLNRKYA